MSTQNEPVTEPISSLLELNTVSPEEQKQAIGKLVSEGMKHLTPRQREIILNVGFVPETEESVIAWLMACPYLQFEEIMNNLVIARKHDNPK